MSVNDKNKYCMSNLWVFQIKMLWYNNICSNFVQELQLESADKYWRLELAHFTQYSEHNDVDVHFISISSFVKFYQNDK